jgi:hypothetical protein
MNTLYRFEIQSYTHARRSYDSFSHQGHCLLGDEIFWEEEGFQMYPQRGHRSVFKKCKTRLLRITIMRPRTIAPAIRYNITNNPPYAMVER